MKKLILLISIVLTLPLFVNAEDLWVDVNFTRDSVFWGQGTTPPQQNNQLYDNREFPGGYIVHGQFGRFTAAMQKINADNSEEKFIMSHRMARAVANQFVMPRVPNVGNIKIHFYNAVNTYAGYLPLQKNTAAAGEAPVWVDFDPPIEFYIPVNGSSTTSFVKDTTLNLGETQLRFAPIRNPYISASNIPNVQIYTISITKNLASNTLNNELENLNLKVSNKSLRIEGVKNDFKATVFTLTGSKVGNFVQNESYNFQSSGVYLVKIDTKLNSITKKIVVR